MKCRLSLLLSLCLVCSLLSPALAAEEAPVTALCVSEPGGSAFLDREEFQLLCRQATGHELESVTFSSATPRAGKLTYKGKPIETDTAYYPYDNPQLSKVCFTPYSSRSSRFTGQGEVSFTMTSEEDETVSGKLILYVPKEADDSAELDFSEERTQAKAGDPIPLGDLFPLSTSSEGKTTIFSTKESVLASLTLSLPSSEQGALWMDYDYSNARKLLPDEELFPDREPNLYGVFFVPAKKEAATIRLNYTLTSEKGKTFSGALSLRYLEKTSSTRPSDPDPQPELVSVATQSSPVELTDALRRACASLNIGALQTVSFDTLPATGEGAVLSNRLPVTAGKAYPCNGLTFAPGADFRGGLSLKYTAADNLGFTFSGYLDLLYGYPSGLTFQDMAGWEWAMPAAQFLAEHGYRRGESDFCPGDTVPRIDLIYALARAVYHFNWSAPIPDFPDLPEDKELTTAVAVAVRQGVVLGDGQGRLLPDAPVTRQDALVMIHRAFTDMRKLPAAAADLSVFSDAGDLAPYAREAVENLYARGIVQGNGAGRLDPLSPITRAEMACLLYRAFS